MSSGFQHSEALSAKLYGVNSAHYLEVESTSNYTKHGPAAARIAGKLTLQFVEYLFVYLAKRSVF